MQYVILWLSYMTLRSLTARSWYLLCEKSRLSSGKKARNDNRRHSFCLQWYRTEHLRNSSFYENFRNGRLLYLQDSLVLKLRYKPEILCWTMIRFWGTGAHLTSLAILGGNDNRLPNILPKVKRIIIYLLVPYQVCEAFWPCFRRCLQGNGTWFYENSRTKLCQIL